MGILLKLKQSGLVVMATFDIENCVITPRQMSLSHSKATTPDSTVTVASLSVQILNIW